MIFSGLIKDAKDMIKLPVEIEIIEAEFGELNKHINIKEITKYDLIVTSGAHLEYIYNSLKELTYQIPIYPLEIMESDLVKSLVEAKKYNEKDIILMTYANKSYKVKEYLQILELNLTQLSFDNLKEATNMLKQYKNAGWKVVIGTSVVCEIAKDLEMYSTLIYSKEFLKKEFLKAFQIAATRKKMVKSTEVNKSLL